MSEMTFRYRSDVGPMSITSVDPLLQSVKAVLNAGGGQGG